MQIFLAICTGSKLIVVLEKTIFFKKYMLAIKTNKVITTFVHI